MKHRNLLCLLTLAGAIVLSGTAFAQGSGNRLFNPLSVQFRRDWDVTLPEPVKLIDVGMVTPDKHPNLVMLVGGKDRNDYKRKLIVAHWNGLNFATDYTHDFLGTYPDALLVGHFRTPKPVTAPVVKPAKGKSKTPPVVANQIVTTEGIYEWTNGDFARLFNAPANLKLSVVAEKGTDQLVSGTGDQAEAFEVGDTDAHRLDLPHLPADGTGYVHFGSGTQEFPGAEAMDFAPGVRYIQSYWSDRRKWFLGLIKGKPAGIQNEPTATTGDRLVVYTPKYANRDKIFWALKPADLEETWRSEPLTGRVLDVRVGDPRDDGKEGILVLTAENNDKVHRLTFYAVAGGGIQGR
jgi:hypothetical protein